jgi:hypothetical protein
VRLHRRGHSLPGCRYRTDDEIAGGERFAGHLPGIDVANHAAAPALGIDCGEAERIDAGVHRHHTEKCERLGRARAGRRQALLGAPARRHLVLVVDHHEADGVLASGHTGLSDVGGDQQLHFVARRILLRERRHAHR